MLVSQEVWYASLSHAHDRYTETLSLRQIHRHTYAEANAHIHTHTHTNTFYSHPSLILTNSLSRIHTHSLTHSRSISLTRTHFLNQLIHPNDVGFSWWRSLRTRRWLVHTAPQMLLQDKASFPVSVIRLSLHC